MIYVMPVKKLKPFLTEVAFPGYVRSMYFAYHLNEKTVRTSKKLQGM